MTMQIGMVATDGLVLASDTRWTTSPFVAGSGARHSYGSSKIRLDNAGRIAVTCARDMVRANRVAEEVISGLTGEDWKNRAQRIREIGSKVAGDHDTECIVAFADPTPSLYLFQYTKSGSDVVSERIINFVHAGDTVNAAVFWAMSYYRLLPVSQLMGLAAHLIVAAGALNTAMISGLEIVFCDVSGFHRLPEETNRELESKARQWEKTIGNLVLNHSS